MTGFYSRGGKSLLHGTDRFLIQSRLHFVFKRLRYTVHRERKAYCAQGKNGALYTGNERHTVHRERMVHCAQGMKGTLCTGKERHAVHRERKKETDTTSGQPDQQQEKLHQYSTHT